MTKLWQTKLKGLKLFENSRCIPNCLLWYQPFILFEMLQHKNFTARKLTNYEKTLNFIEINYGLAFPKLHDILD